MNKDIKNLYYIKLILIILLFWLIVVILPLKIFSYITKNGSLVIDYLIIVPIIIFSILYYFTKPKATMEKIIYIIFGFLIPYIFLLFYIYLGIIRGFNPKIF